jgi:LacI family transcriptional regulator
MLNIRQSDIASKLNISRVTVSKALRDHPDISREMKRKIAETAARMGYVPNMIARQLNSSRTYTIGIVIPDLENSFFSYIVDSMIDYAAGENFFVILTVSREKENVELRNVQNLLGLRVDGLLVCISQETRNTDIYSGIKRMKIPLVFFDRVADVPGFSTIVFDDRKGALEALSIVIGKGYRKIAHFAGYSAINIGKDRRLGYLDALKKHGIPINAELIIERGYEVKDGYDSFMELMARGSLPEVIFAVNDRVALGAYNAAKDNGIRIPEDIGIMGYGFSETADIFSPPLSVINQDPRKMGRLAVETLIAEINSNGKNKPGRILLPEEFRWDRSLKQL